MKNNILLGIIVICLLCIGVFMLVNKPFSTKEANKVDTNISSKEDTNTSNKVENNNEEVSDDVIGKWNTVSAVNSKTGDKVTNMRDIFGSSYQEYGSYLDLKSDGTFIDAIRPITNGSKSTTGKYEVKKDYYKPGDLYIFLTYSDGTEGKLERVLLDDTGTYYLVLENLIDDYQLTLKK